MDTQKPAVEGREQQQQQPLKPSQQPTEPQSSTEKAPAQGEQPQSIIDRLKGGPRKIQGIMDQAALRANPGPVMTTCNAPEEGTREERMARTQEMNKDN